MAAQVAEVGSVPAADYLSTSFSRLPRDERFSHVQYIEFHSVVNYESSGTSLIFVLLPTDPPVSYDLSDPLIKCQVKITKADGKPIEKSKVVIPVNNSCLSLFDSLETRCKK